MSCQCLDCNRIFPNVASLGQHKCLVKSTKCSRCGEGERLPQRTICQKCKRESANESKAAYNQRRRDLALESQHFAYVMPEKPCASWYDGKPVLSAEECEQKDREQREIDRRALAKYNAQFQIMPARILTPEEIKALAPKITPVSDIPEYHAPQPRFI